jgi:ADP-ribose pyrophosphatase YjhB (NUDIX family)
MFKKNAHCSYCGSAFGEDQPWPRRCATCGNITYLNPTPVAVVLLPVDGGLLMVRRSIPPHIGKLALPGGYINLGETWQQAGARELIEETSIVIDPLELREFRVLSVPEGMILIFGLARPRSLAELPPFQPTDEASECLVGGPAEEVAFELHQQVVQELFSGSRAPVV